METTKVAHYGDPSHRANNQHACGAKMMPGDNIAWSKAGGDDDRENVTCPDCHRVICGLQSNSVYYDLSMMREQEKMEKKYYKKNKKK